MLKGCRGLGLRVHHKTISICKIKAQIRAKNSQISNFFYFCIFCQWSLKTVKGLNPKKKSAVLHNLPPYFLHLTAGVIAQTVSNVLILFLIFGEELLCYLYQKGGDPTLLNNYQPISEVCIPAKVLEKLVNDQLKKKKNLVSNQSGFKEQHSTVTASIKLLNANSKTLWNTWIHKWFLTFIISPTDTSVSHVQLSRTAWP